MKIIDDSIPPPSAAITLYSTIHYKYTSSATVSEASVRHTSPAGEGYVFRHFIDQSQGFLLVGGGWWAAEIRPRPT